MEAILPRSVVPEQPARYFNLEVLASKDALASPGKREFELARIRGFHKKEIVQGGKLAKLRMKQSIPVRWPTSAVPMLMRVRIGGDVVRHAGG